MIFEGIRSFCVLENSNKEDTSEKQEKRKVEENVNAVRHESLGVVHTHTHTHTGNLKKEEKRVGENSALKVMKKDGQKKEENFLIACLFCVLYTGKKYIKRDSDFNRKYEKYEKEGVEDV